MPAETRPLEDWKDRIFVRHGETPIFLVDNAVEDAPPREFPTREAAEAWVAEQGPYRAEIEHWARVIDKRTWEAYDKDPRDRQALFYDTIYASLANAIRIHAVICAPVVAAEEHGGEWGFMATAPRDGTSVDLLCEDGRYLPACEWDRSETGQEGWFQKNAWTWWNVGLGRTFKGWRPAVAAAPEPAGFEASISNDNEV